MDVGVGPDGTPFAFHDLPEEKFPITISAFGPDGSMVWTETVEPYVVQQIPATGPGSVRYVAAVYADGTGIIYDDPSCYGTLPAPDEGRMRNALLRIGGARLDGMQGFHFMGDDEAPDTCPGCIAQQGLGLR
jgi:hypothetical protein